MTNNSYYIHFINWRYVQRKKCCKQFRQCKMAPLQNGMYKNKHLEQHEAGTTIDI